ncbi:DUF4097 family beta strand repeat-containing protein [Roseateles sp. BYS180W]|uniref:DUF4097 family beta strand repeat-containing protein n=1 Tax=Roseateles rivi TaxID=3299028 RepID=A0ABW7FTH1_9BURK
MLKTSKVLALVSALLLGAPLARAQAQLDVAADTAQALSVRSAVAFNQVQGHQGPLQLRLHGPAGLTLPTLALQRHGQTLVLDLGQLEPSLAAQLRLDVFLPAAWTLKMHSTGQRLRVAHVGAAVQLSDEAGAVFLENVGRLQLHDEGGDIELNNAAWSAAAQVRIQDGAGHITVRHFNGQLRINDGAGDITAQQLKGQLRIEDGSGWVDVSGAEQVFLHDGSGDLRVRDAKSLVLERDRSGAQSITNVPVIRRVD